MCSSMDRIQFPRLFAPSNYEPHHACLATVSLWSKQMTIAAGIAYIRDPKQLERPARNQWAAVLVPVSAKMDTSITAQLEKAEAAYQEAFARRQAAFRAMAEARQQERAAERGSRRR